MKFLGDINGKFVVGKGEELKVFLLDIYYRGFREVIQDSQNKW